MSQKIEAFIKTLNKAIKDHNMQESISDFKMKFSDDTCNCQDDEVCVSVYNPITGKITHYCKKKDENA